MAERLGIVNVDRDILSLTAKQLRGWEHYYELTLSESVKADYRTAHIVQILANINRDTKKRPQPYKLKDMVLSWEVAETPQPGARVKTAVIIPFGPLSPITGLPIASPVTIAAAQAAANEGVAPSPFRTQSPEEQAALMKALAAMHAFDGAQRTPEESVPVAQRVTFADPESEARFVARQDEEQK